MDLVAELKSSLTEEVVGETGVIITPPSVFLSDVVNDLVDNPFIAVAESCHELDNGAYTGEISAYVGLFVGRRDCRPQRAPSVLR